MPKLAGLIALLLLPPFMGITSVVATEPPLAKVTVATGDTAAASTSGEAPSPVCLLQVREDVEVASRIIRLKDILSPVGPPPPGWNRAASAAVALLPSDGRRLRIERQRVSESVRRSGFITAAIRVVGPDYVSVRYVPLATPSVASEQVVVPAGYPHDPQSPAPFTTSAPSDASMLAGAYARPTPDRPPLLPAERNRVQRMIDAAFRGTHADLAERFEFSVAETDPGLDLLGGLRAVRGLRLLSPPVEGTVVMEVLGDGESGEIIANVKVDLVALPMVVVAVTALDRGDIISARDVATEPLPRNQFRDDYVTNLDSLVGKEVVRSVGMGRPIRFDDTSEPIVIDRGDLIELRVVAGGVTVTTNAKAMAPAATGEMIMVETDSPRRRLMARAVRSGVAEILTRPPTTETQVDGD